MPDSNFVIERSKYKIRAITIMDTTTRREVYCFKMRLLWIEKEVESPKCYLMIERRLERLECRMDHDPELKEILHPFQQLI